MGYVEFDCEVDEIAVLLVVDDFATLPKTHQLHNFFIQCMIERCVVETTFRARLLLTIPNEELN
jgi:hypothetical protein